MTLLMLSANTVPLAVLLYVDGCQRRGGESDMAGNSRKPSSPGRRDAR